MALIDLHDYVTRSFSKELYTLGVFLDLTKAFDSIDFAILFDKLKCYGIRGLSLSWFENYFHGRTHMLCTQIYYLIH